MLQIPVQVQLQQIPRIITRPPGLGRLGAFESQLRHFQPLHKRIDHPADMIVGDQLLQRDRKQASLCPSFSLHKAHKKCPRFREGIFSFPNSSSNCLVL